MIEGRCTCPFVPFPDDPYFHCDYCDARLEAAHEDDEQSLINEAHAMPEGDFEWVF